MCPRGKVARLASRISMSENANALESIPCRSEVAIAHCTLAAGIISSNSDRKNSVLSIHSLV